MKLFVAGGAGFIGSAFVRAAFDRWPGVEVTVFDLLTYSGNLADLQPVAHRPDFRFVQGDIADPEPVRQALAGATHVVNFAAETHVDRSILDPAAFVRTNVEGTRVLLDAARAAGVERYLQVSTDEVYGDVPAPRLAAEDDPLRPRSPYAATKAAGELLTLAYHTTYGLPAVVTRGSNTYGPYQYPEKLLSLFITNALDGLPLPVYGDGLQVRDWLYVSDHCEGIAAVLERGQPGEAYNLAGGNERPNLMLIDRVVDLTGVDPSLVRHVPDRPGHDRRYALSAEKAGALGWRPVVPFERGLEETVSWYATHRDWWEPIKSGQFQEYYRRQYAARLAEGQR